MTALDAAFDEILARHVEVAVDRVRAELEASMRHLRPVAVPAAAAGKLLGVSASTVRRLVAEGHLPRVPHLGDRVVIPVAAIEAFADPRAHAPPTAA